MEATAETNPPPQNPAREKVFGNPPPPLAPTQSPMATSSAANHRLLVPDSPGAADRPLVICFHGSGESCSPSWDALAGLLLLLLPAGGGGGPRVLLYDRGPPPGPRPGCATADLRAYLRRERLAGPYVLVAHSYGGAFARTFLHLHRHGHRGRAGAGTGAGADAIAGMVLVETGQEGGLDPAVEAAQQAGCPLGARPLSVVRGNSLIAKWKALEEAEAEARAGAGADIGTDASLRLQTQREMLQRCDEEDERLKKRQLALSRNARYVHVPDCGHHVVRDRPDVVAAEVCWVLEDVEDAGQRGSGHGEGRGGFCTTAFGRLCRVFGR